MAAFRVRRSDLVRETLLTLTLVGLAGLIALSVSGLGLSSHLHGSGHASMAGMDMTVRKPHSDGLSETERGYRLVPDRVPTRTGADQPLEFRVVGPERTAVTDFEVIATKRLHFFVIRDDMSYFQHVHPTASSGVWRTEVDIPDGGAYRMYAEFVPPGSTDVMHPVVLGRTFVVPGDTRFIPLPEPAATARAGDLTVTRADGAGPVPRHDLTTLTFEVTGPDGEPAELEPYLGSYAHVSAFNALTLSVTHLHPTEPATPGADPPDRLTVRARFAERGEHRVFVEFQVDGEVYSALFTLFVD